MSNVGRVLKNSGFLLFGRIATKIISFFVILYIARHLGPADFGIYSFAFAFIYFFGFIPDIGLHNILVRESAKEPKLAGKLIGNATIVKIILSIIAFFLALVVITLIDYPVDTKNALYITSFGLLFASLGAFGVVYEVNLRMEYSVLFGLISRIFFLSFTIFAIRYDLTLLYFVFAFVAADLMHTIFMVLFSKKFVKPSFKIDYKLMRNLLHEALPIAITSVFVMIYFKIDVVMLSMLTTDEDVGIYSAAYRLAEAFTFLPTILMTSIFPLLSKYFKDSFELFIYVYKVSFKLLFTLGLVLAVTITFISDIIILNVYGLDFLNSISVLQILIWATAIMFLNILNSFTYISSNNQKIMAKISFFAAIINIVLNLLLIPQFSYNGAGAATLFTEAIVMLFGMYWLHKNVLFSNLLREIFIPLIAITIITIILVLLKPFMNIILLVILSIPVFYAILYIMGWLTEDDKKLLQKSLKKKSV